ncbi:MAG TPA: hypothetical protein VE196_04315, partial [Pseudonocardiaceae bacterium]|nr:hypothetical protein [Pseudonocardiaceae bacterium]
MVTHSRVGVSLAAQATPYPVAQSSAAPTAQRLALRHRVAIGAPRGRPAATALHHVLGEWLGWT